ncbi:unnamed protein product [Lathyrus oleraceus]
MAKTPKFYCTMVLFISILLLLKEVCAYRKCETVQDCPDFSHMPDIICNCIKKKCTCFGGNEYKGVHKLHERGK